MLCCLGPNPHMGHLAWANAFVITADSVSMLTEAYWVGLDYHNQPLMLTVYIILLNLSLPC